MRAARYGATLWVDWVVPWRLPPALISSKKRKKRSFIDLGWWSAWRRVCAPAIWRLTLIFENGGSEVFPIKTCQSIRPWSNRNEANWGHRSGVRLRLIDGTGGLKTNRGDRARSVWLECIRNPSGKRKQYTDISRTRCRKEDWPSSNLS